MTLAAEEKRRADAIRSTRFRIEREAGWKQLEALVNRAEKGGVRGLSYEDTVALAGLYRQAINSLSVARAISMDKALLTYLEALCARAYLVVYAPQESITGAIARLFTHGIPQAVRRCSVPLLVGFLAILLGFFTGLSLFMQDETWFYTFVDSGLSDGRAPGASSEYLRDTLFGADTDTYGGFGVFASYLFSHNTQIAIFVFALGIFISLPSFVLTFYNGLMVGAFAGVFIKAGLGYELFGWLSIHGVTELSAICVACAGGAQLGLAVLLPGNKPRRLALLEKGRDAVKLMILAGLMLVVAALVEGFLRQMVQDTETRLVIGWGLGLGWLGWLTFSGRERDKS